MQSYTLLIALCFFAVASAKFVFIANIELGVNLDFEWHDWKLRHEREYETLEEDTLRRKIWEDNLAYIQQFNSENHTYTLGLNDFSDLTNKEYQEIYLGYRGDLKKESSNLHEMDTSARPAATVDWRTKGAVTPVKNQERCGSCWSFSATGSVEGQYFLKHQVLKSFSEQQLMDCSTSYGNHGCKGGLMDLAFEYLERNKDEQEVDYPYEAKDGSCRAEADKEVVGVSSYRDVPRGSCSSLQDAVSSVGPVSVAMDASHRSFQSYRSGIYTERACSSVKLDHGVLVVGYGEDYWLVKNSWGTVWGMEGYFEISMENNMCGLCTQASYPQVD